MPLVVPQLHVRNGRAAVAFYQQAFGATIDFQLGGDDANPSVVAQLSIDGSTFWVEDESPEHDNYSPESVEGPTTKLLLVVDDPATAQAQAIAAGATEVMPVGENYGWILGRLRDPFGHHWEIGRPVGDWPNY